MSKILEYIYIGNHLDARNSEFLSKNNFTHILSAAKELEPDYSESRSCLHLKLRDKSSFDLTEHLDDAVSFIRQAIDDRGKVLVYCHRGVSRSASCVIAYMVKQRSMTVKDALSFCIDKRPQIKPNKGFMDCLCKYEQSTNKAAEIDKIDIVSTSVSSPVSLDTLKPVWKSLSLKKTLASPNLTFTRTINSKMIFMEDLFKNNS